MSKHLIQSPGCYEQTPFIQAPISTGFRDKLRIKCRDSGSCVQTYWHIDVHKDICVCQHLCVFKVVLSIDAALLLCELSAPLQLCAAASLTVSAFMRLIS